MPITTAILLHGYPERGKGADARPADQLKVLRLALEAAGVTCRDVEWGTYQNDVARGIAAMKGTLHTDLAGPVRQRIAEILAATSADSSVALIGYSFGGYLAYQWLLDRAVAPEDRERVLLVITIASPHHIDSGGILLEQLQDPPAPPGQEIYKRWSSVQIDPVDPILVAQEIGKVRGRRLVVVYSEGDKTIVMPFLDFADAADKLAAGVEQFESRGAHRVVRRHANTVQKVLSLCRES